MEPSPEPTNASERRLASEFTDIDASGSMGVQINSSGNNIQVNLFGTRASHDLKPATPEEFRADLMALIERVDEEACRGHLPSYLPPETDVTLMTRTVRALSRVRKAAVDELDRRRVYALPAEYGDHAGDPSRSWTDVARAYDRLIVLADPGMGKSWLVRTETHRLAQEARSLLESPATAGDALVPITIRADVLASAPGRTLGEAVGGYLMNEGYLPLRSGKLMEERIAAGGVALLIDALDEVPRDASTSGVQVPLKRLEELLYDWAGNCTGTAKCVLTARLAGYSGPPLPGSHEVELLPFTDDDAIAAIRAWELPELSAARVRDLFRDPAMAGMARIPLLLALICSLSLGLPGQELPRTRVALYEAVLWNFLSRTHRSADRWARTPAASPAERQNLLLILGKIAIKFASTDRGWVDRMSYADLVAAISDTGSQILSGVDSADAVLAHLTNQAGVLVPIGNPAISDTPYVFLHRTFAEYLVARYLCDLEPGQRMKIVKEHQWFDPDWAEVIPMLGGLLAARHPAEAQSLVAHFLNQGRDPLYRSLRTALFIVRETSDPDMLNSSDIGKRISRIFAYGSRWPGLEDALDTMPVWPRAVTEALLRSLTRRNFGMRMTALTILKNRQEPGVTEAILRSTTDKNWLIRAEACSALANRHDPEVTEALLGLLHDNFQAVQVSAVNALAERQDSSVTMTLLGLLSNLKTLPGSYRYTPVRSSAIYALSKAGDPQLSDVFLNLLDDQDDAIRAAAVDVLSERNELSTETLLGLLSDSHEDVRWAAAEALGKSRDPHLRETLIGMIGTAEKDVRSAAILALTEWREPLVTETLLSLDGDEDKSVRMMTARALRGRSEPGATKALLGLLDDEDEEVRLTAIRGLFDSRETKVTSFLFGLLRHKNGKVREEALKALGRRSDQETVAWICEHRLWLTQHNAQRSRLHLAEVVVDHTYLLFQSGDRSRILRRLWVITRNTSVAMMLLRFYGVPAIIIGTVYVRTILFLVDFMEDRILSHFPS